MSSVVIIEVNSKIFDGLGVNVVVTEKWDESCVVPAVVVHCDGVLCISEEVFVSPVYLHRTQFVNGNVEAEDNAER